MLLRLLIKGKRKLGSIVQPHVKIAAGNITFPLKYLLSIQHETPTLLFTHAQGYVRDECALYLILSSMPVLHSY